MQVPAYDIRIIFVFVVVINVLNFAAQLTGLTLNDSLL